MSQLQREDQDIHLTFHDDNQGQGKELSGRRYSMPSLKCENSQDIQEGTHMQMHGTTAPAQKACDARTKAQVTWAMKTSRSAGLASDKEARCCFGIDSS